MHIVHVSIRVKPDCLAACQSASRSSATASILKPIVARFDVIQQANDTMRFVLAAVYRSPADQAAQSRYVLVL
jgi:autoinducer 2-degrading protein